MRLACLPRSIRYALAALCAATPPLAPAHGLRLPTLDAGLGWPAKPAPSEAAPMAESPAGPAALTPAQVRFRTRAFMTAGIDLTALYGYNNWWQDGFSGGFKTSREGWFGQNTDYGGADKLGHAFFGYAGTRLMTRAFRWSGNDDETALRLGFWTAVGTLLGVEVLDGFSQKWRFSTEDAIVNVAGGLLGWWLESHPAADELIDVRLQYSRSSGPDGKRRFDPFGDYSGQRYVLALKASGVPALREWPLLRYLELNLGYAARDYEVESRAVATPTRYRYVGVSLNLSELLRGTVYKDRSSPSRMQQFTEGVFEFVQVPAAAWTHETAIR
jgi:hypothetical protein